MARCKLGPYYERRPDGGGSLFAAGERAGGAALAALRAYTGVYAADEEIPNSDVFFAALE